jgi:hypothetical protein
MKSGRPNARKKVAPLILKCLGESRVPLTVSALARTVSKEIGSTASWNTIQKYLRELIEANKVDAISLPHSKSEDKNGLTVYALKK